MKKTQPKKHEDQLRPQPPSTQQSRGPAGIVTVEKPRSHLVPIRELERRITNQDLSHLSLCPFRTGGPGMDDFAFLAKAFTFIGNSELKRLMGMIDQIRASQKCGACHIKVLAFSEFFTEGRLPELYHRYRAAYDEWNEGMMKVPRHKDRDFRQEIRDAIRRADSNVRQSTGWQFREPIEQ